MNFEIRRFDQLSNEVLDDLVVLEKTIFEKPLTTDVFSSELTNRHQLIILIAYADSDPCGYKIGFEYSSNTFFSWSGGIIPNFRRQGMAKGLLRQQHLIARELGYAYVRTHTKNKYREMLILNIQFGFDVIGIYKSLCESQQGIILEKHLKEAEQDAAANP